MDRASLRGLATLAALASLTLAALGGSAVAQDAATYDPLTLAIPLYLTSDGKLAETAPAGGGVYVPATDPTAMGAAAAVNFTLATPTPFKLDALDVTLSLVADKPVAPAQDANGNAIEVAVYADGKAIKGAVKDVALPKPVLAPGDAASVHAVVPTAGASLAKGGTLTLSVRTTLPALADSALRIALGKATSAVLSSAHVPSVQDLELEDGPLQVFDPQATSFTAPAGSVASTVLVGHANVTFPTLAPEASGRTVDLVFVGTEPPADAHAHDALSPDARRALAHTFRVGGTLVRVHPGVAVVVPVAPQPGAVAVTCVANCQVGVQWAVPFTSDTVPPPPTPGISDVPNSALVPPPPATTGIPVSKDAPAAKGVPAPGLALVVVGLVLVAALRRR